MGIGQARETDAGYEVTYGRIFSSPSLSVDGRGIELSVAWYRDKQARFSGKKPADYQTVFLTLTKEEVKGILAILYQALSRAEGFVGAEKIDPDPEKEER